MTPYAIRCGEDEDDLLLRVWNKEAENIMTLDEELIKEEIRKLAYYKWEYAGHPPGDGVCFWLEAEKEIIAVLGLEMPPDPEELIMYRAPASIYKSDWIEAPSKQYPYGIK